MNTLTPPPNGDQDRGPAFLAASWTMFSVAALFTSLRFYARFRIHALGLDDWVMLLTTFLFLAVTITSTLLCLHGGGRHLYYLVLDQRYPSVTRSQHITLPLSYISLAAGRISVAILILRIITRSKWRRRFLYFSITTSFAINVAWSIMWFVGCPPATNLAGPYIAGYCWNPNVMFAYSSFTACWNIFMDLALALLPVSIFWKLQLSRKKRLGLCVFTAWGLLAAVSGALKTANLKQINAVDFTWAEFNLYVWSTVENFLIIVCGCIPTLKPVYDQLSGSKFKLKAWYSTLVYKRSVQSSTATQRSDVENGNQQEDLKNLQRPSPVYRDRPVRIHYPMELGLWSTTGSERDNDTSVRNMDTDDEHLSTDNDSRHLVTQHERVSS